MVQYFYGQLVLEFIGTAARSYKINIDFIYCKASHPLILKIQNTMSFSLATTEHYFQVLQVTCFLHFAEFIFYDSLSSQTLLSFLYTDRGIASRATQMPICQPCNLADEKNNICACIMLIIFFRTSLILVNRIHYVFLRYLLFVPRNRSCLLNMPVMSFMKIIRTCSTV